MAPSTSVGVLLDHAQDKIVLLDEQGQFTYVNAAVERIAGYEPADLIGEISFEYIHPEDIAEVEAAFGQTIESETFTETTVEYRFRRSDGSWVWLESRMSNLTDEDLDGYVVSSRDISERVAAERGQRETATRLEELAATTGDVLWMFNSDWTETLFVNPAYQSVYGRPIEEVQANPDSFLETIHPDDVPKVEEAMTHLTGGQSVNIEYRANPETDYGVWVWVQAEPIFEDGEVVRITGFTRDVTDRRRRERQLYVMDNLLRHNLRNDLTTIMANADLIEERVPETAEQTAIIRQTGEELLDSAEKERDIIDLLTTEQTQCQFDIRDVVRTSVDVIEKRFPTVSLDVTCPDTASVNAVDGLELAVVELVENAVRHSERDHPLVGITVRRTDQQVVISVEDEAEAFPEIEARVLTGDHEMSDVYHSTGLGLWLIYWVVELSDGDITVTPNEGEGNRVRITLPSADTASADD